jgi:hypothetical protein
VPVNQSAGPWLEGVEPHRLISILIYFFDFLSALVSQLPDFERPKSETIYKINRIIVKTQMPVSWRREKLWKNPSSHPADPVHPVKNQS